MLFFFFNQKTAYDMRISDWSSDVCSSDLVGGSGDTFKSGNDGGLPDLAWASHFCCQVVGADGNDVDAFDGGDRIDVFDAQGRLDQHLDDRSEERRGGRACVRTCRCRWVP